MKVARFEDEHPHKKTIVSNSMSQDYIFGLSHGFERPCQDHQHQSQITGLEDDTGAGMLSEMFNFPIGSGHQHNNPSSSSSTFHILLPNTVPNQQLSWVPPGELSLSLSSTLQHLEGAKLEELRIGDDPETGMLYFNQGGDPYVQNMVLEGGVMSPTRRPINIGYGSSSLGVVKLLRSSRYVKAAQDLLEELCSVGRGESKMNKYSKSNQNPSNSDDGSSSFKDLGPLSSAERIEHQRRKSKLLAMLDEVDRRYNRYCEQMQIVVNSFDSVLGFGAAVPYTALAQKAMSRHFRCLKDAIVAQLKHTCGLLGEKDVGSYGVTKGETPRLKLLDQSLRQQRAFHHMGVMEPEAWRPQRGLPERSVNILRAWLFEHFLHPYPSDADKHMLARQTGLSRNQVSNWFINARVRLWKPMVEDMYQQESKEEEAENNNNSPPPHHHHHQDQDQEHEDKENPKYQNNYKNKMNNNKSAPIITTITTPTATHAKISEINESETENDPSLFAMNAEYCFSEIQAYSYSGISNTTGGSTTEPAYDGDSCQRSSMLGAEYRTTTGDDAADMIGSRLITFGTTSGDVSLTLGLHHTGNLLDKPSFFS